MELKTRSESDELLKMRYLNNRMTLSDDDKTRYTTLEKGYEGELKFDSLIHGLTDNFITLNDLLFEVNNQHFQIDTLIIKQHSINPFEVKNLEGDYYIKNEKWYSCFGTPITNPISQMERSEVLLRRLLLKLGYSTVNPNLVFVNPSFHLYHAPMNKQIVFPNQLNRFLTSLDKQPSVLDDSHFILAERLLSLHIKTSPYSKVPKYEYKQLRKETYCGLCFSFNLVVSNHTLVCSNCGHKESVSSAILRSVREYMLLFPERKVTTSGVMEWCGIINTKKAIRKVLSANYKLVEHGRTSFYLPNDIDS
ncbi:NERD domain-containing protein [Bacillus sp. DNRA2]|uniref:nuclease-related domain-containing protein n=1 Tax=Bacillus sp. DNRA2 TaxID=2723053 RepID=UPI00145E51F5|nr:nuclease-related domain-containing protein [Bacillus sp. DNRA2]NMD69728.1 NERD domain-containing protein [Bacillus sp. DNRA2]